jgi:hypothetical protein
MTLKEKLFNTVFDNAWEYKHENTVPELEQIADDYAIDFTEWLDLQQTEDLIYSLGIFGEDITYKELLEIFKKEKGL